MKRITTLLLLVFSLPTLHADGLLNGDFREGLKHWLHDNKGVCIDPVVKAGEKPAARIPARAELRQHVAIKPDRVYELSYLVKGENISRRNPGRNGARIMLNSGKAWARVTPNSDGSCLTGTFDWKRHVWRFDSSRFPNSRLTVKLILDTDGKCYFADLKLTEVGAAPVKTETAKDRYFRESYPADYPLPALYPANKAAGFVEPGEAAGFRLRLKALLGLEYGVTVRNELGETVYEQPRKAYADGEIFTVPGQKRGYYIVEVSAFAENRKIAMVQGAFVSVPKMAKRDPFFQINQFGIVSDLIDGYRHLGAGSVVLPLIWNEKGDPAVNARKRFLGTYKVFLDSDFDVYMMLVGGVSQADCDIERFRKGYPMYEPKHYEAIEAAATEAAKIVKGKVKGYSSIMEIPSMANMRHKHCGTWTEAMAQQLFLARIFARAVRKVDPQAKISAGGNNVQMHTEPIERIVMTDLADDFDVYSIDAYCGNWDLTRGAPSIPEKSLRSFYLEASKLAGSLGKPAMVRNTETGYNIHYGDRYDRGLARLQAALTARTLVISKSAPVESVAVFRAATTYGGKFEQPREGCMTTVWKPVRDGGKIFHTPLPGGAAYATCARELAFVKFRREITTGDKAAYAYCFTRPDGKTLLAAWTVEGGLALELDLARPARLISMFGRESALQQGKCKLALTTEPVFVVTDAPWETVAAQVAKCFLDSRPLYRSAAKLTAPGRAMLYVANTGTEKTTVAAGGKTLEILPGATGSLEVAVRPGQNAVEAVAADGTRIAAPVIADTVKVTKLARTPVFDGSGAWLPERPSGKLVVPDHVKPGEALQPERGYFKSSMNPGGHDISAVYYLAYDKDNFYLAVKADDPVHQQRYKGQNLWRDDSVQFVLAVRPAPPTGARLLDTPLKDYTAGKNYGVALTPRGTEFVRYGSPKPPEMKALVTRRGGETFYEIAIPWSEIGTQPGGVLYFDFVVFDNNKSTEANAPYYLDMASGVAGNRDDALLPLVIFE